MTGFQMNKYLMKPKLSTQEKEKRRLKQSVKRAIERCFSQSKLTQQVKQNAYNPNKKGIRGGKTYVCNVCKQSFGLGKIQIDHIKPKIPVNISFHELSYDELVKAIFCSIENLQVLCKICHQNKTLLETKTRKEHRNRKKGL